MIITVDPSQSEDIAAFAMVKQYRMQALNVTLNGGTGSSAWQAVQGGEGYTQTVVTAVTGIELVYEDPNAIVSYTVENDDTSNYDTASDAGIILSSIEPTDNAWTYTCVFHADSVPVSSVDIDLLVYGNIARGTELQGSPATAEEITAQVLAGLKTRVTALEEEMPDKADKSDTYTKAQVDNAVVHKAGAETITGVKTFTDTAVFQHDDNNVVLSNPNYTAGTNPSSNKYNGVLFRGSTATTQGWISHVAQSDGATRFQLRTYNISGANFKQMELFCMADGTGYASVPTPRSTAPTDAVTTISYVSQTGDSAPNNLVHRSGDETVAGYKSFESPICGGNLLSANSLASVDTNNFVRLARFGEYSQQDIRIYGVTPNNSLGVAEIVVGGSDRYNRSYKIFAHGIFATTAFYRIGTGSYNELWANRGSMAALRVVLLHTTTPRYSKNVLADTGLSTIPSIGDTNPLTGETIDGVNLIT